MNQKTRSPERTRGRPVDTGQQDLKVQILETAEALFAENGYAATSIRSIADQVGVNPALVHYYFGNKKALLQTVMEQALKPMGEAIAAMQDGSGATADEIARLLLSMIVKHPKLPHLLTREVLLPGGEMQEYFAENMAPRLGGALPALLNREKSAGHLRKDADPAISAVLIMAMCVFPFIARALAEPVIGIDFDESGYERLGTQISELLKQGLML